MFLRASHPIALVLAAALVTGCEDQTLPTAVPHARRLASTIADASRDYKPGFYWLPPMVKAAAWAGTFDPMLEPTVEICRLDGNACATVLATYTPTTGPGGEMIRLDLDEQHYHVNWHTNEFDVSGDALYRVSVRAGLRQTLLGFADVQPVNNGSGLRNVDSDEYIGLVDGRTLPIKFRIETEVVGAISVVPVEAEAAPGATQQFAAFVTDLHGESLARPVTWSSSDEQVATIDATGLATAGEDGETSIIATSERVSGVATLTVLGRVAAAGGFNHSCAIARSGRAYCWGMGNLGQLGNGGTANRVVPTAVASDLTFRAITTGTFYACAIASDGAGHCWGHNGSGRLGSGSQTNMRAPVPVVGNFQFTTLSAGNDHTCGVITTGEAYCWGSGSSGQLGDGQLRQALTPIAVAGGLLFRTIDAGDHRTCGVTTDDQAYCWGRNGGDLGVIGPQSLYHPLPTPVSGGHAFRLVDVGWSHICGLTTTGKAYCWGQNGAGQLGIGTFSPWATTPQPAAGDLVFKSISVGGAHTCGVTTAAQGYCWGWGINGRLGNGSTANRNVPTLVSGGLMFESISAGFEHTCGATTEGAVYCWGVGSSGRLGNGTTVDMLVPVRVGEMP